MAPSRLFCRETMSSMAVFWCGRLCCSRCWLGRQRAGPGRLSAGGLGFPAARKECGGGRMAWSPQSRDGNRLVRRKGADGNGRVWRARLLQRTAKGGGGEAVRRVVLLATTAALWALSGRMLSRSKRVLAQAGTKQVCSRPTEVMEKREPGQGRAAALSLVRGGGWRVGTSSRPPGALGDRLAGDWADVVTLAASKDPLDDGASGQAIPAMRVGAVMRALKRFVGGFWEMMGTEETPGQVGTDGCR